MTPNSSTDRTVAALVDLDRYPLHRPASERFQEVCDDVFAELSETGAAVLGGFLTPPGVARLRDEATAMAAAGRKSLVQPPRHVPADRPGLSTSALPIQDPRLRHQAGSGTLVSYDHIPAGSGLRRLYRWDRLTHFLGQACGRAALHRYADPRMALTVNVAHDGDSFAWHFDVNDYSANLALQMPESGGAFEYVPDLRDWQDPHDDEVRQVLDGDRSRVRTVACRPGDLVLFRGRDTLHRVTPSRGARSRCVAIFSYTAIPGIAGRPRRSAGIAAPESRAG